MEEASAQLPSHHGTMDSFKRKAISWENEEVLKNDMLNP